MVNSRQDFNAIKSEKQITLHTIVKNGKLVAVDGTPLPELQEGASVTLRTRANNLMDKDVRLSMQKEHTVLLLEPKQTLYMALNTLLSESHMISELNYMDGTLSRGLSDKLHQNDIEYLNDVMRELFVNHQFNYPSGLLKCDGFVEIELLSPLKLLMKGNEPQQLLPCECHAPYLNQDGYEFKQSLNHVCTQISESFELGRMSHTVNVFKKVFYVDREINQLRPLQYLRDTVTTETTTI